MPLVPKMHFEMEELKAAEWILFLHDSKTMGITLKIINGWFRTFFISQSDRTDLQAQIGTDSREYDITEDDLHWFVLF